VNGQIYVTNNADLFEANGTVAEFDFDGSIINAALVTQLRFPHGIAVSGNVLFVADGGTQSAGIVYRLPITGSVGGSNGFGNSFPLGLTVSGSNLFVTHYASGAIGEYTTSGTNVNPSLVTGLSLPYGITVSPDGADLFVANFSSNSIGEYDALTGATINAALVTGLNQPTGLAISGSHLYIANSGDGTIGQYDATTGAAINATLITGLSNPQGIAVVPEPVAWLLLVLGAVWLAFFVRPLYFRVQYQPGGPGSVTVPTLPAVCKSRYAFNSPKVS
jgi:DNA-binding beta-propeller fold protein YncE